MAFSQRRRRSMPVSPPAGELNVVKDRKTCSEGRRQADFLGSLLRRCGKAKSLYGLQHLHAHLTACGLEFNTFLGNCLIQGYGNCGRVGDAKACFGFINSNCYSWTLLIQACAENGFLDDALVMFERNPFKDVVTWNATIALLAKHGCSKEALDLFHAMADAGVKPNCVTFLCTIDACSILGCPNDGEKLHATIVDCGYGKNLAVGSALIDMYGKWGLTHKARIVFDSLPQQDVVLWTSMISAYAVNGDLEEALYLFNQMQLTNIKPDVVLNVSLLNICTKLRALDEGKLIHMNVEENNHSRDVMVATALINLYGKCAHVHDALSVFGRLSHRDIVSVNAIITAFDQNECGAQALSRFYELCAGRGLDPNNVTFVCVLDTCSNIAALEEGKLIHANTVWNGLEKNSLISFALINMYGKAGSVRNAKDLFSRIANPNLITWNSMIALLSHNGESKEVFDVFHQMQSEGVKPDDSTFVSILTACSHSGYVEHGFFIFFSIDKIHNVMPTVAHCLTLLDLLSRTGRLDEAEGLIYNIPLDIVGVAWRCLLGACIIHGDKERCVRAENY